MTGHTVGAELDRFLSDLTKGSWSKREPAGTEHVDDRGLRGRHRKISDNEIYEQALELLDREGASALTVRRLADDLRISTRTLYKRAGSRGNVVRNAVRLHVARLDIEPAPDSRWESAASQWCLALHEVLTGHPHLTDLLDDDDAHAIERLGCRLVNIAVGEGFSREVAHACCRVLVSVTINDAMRQVRSTGGDAASDAAAQSSAVPTSSFIDAISWILAGVRADTAPVGDF